MVETWRRLAKSSTNLAKKHANLICVDTLLPNETAGKKVGHVLGFRAARSAVRGHDLPLQARYGTIPYLLRSRKTTKQQQDAKPSDSLSLKEH